MPTEPSLTELRRAVVDDPLNAELRYLLGAEMAQQRDYESAVMEISAAVALNPLLHVARFQLGLLLLTMTRSEQALTVLGPLEDLHDSAALKRFKRALEALIKDDFDTCMTRLVEGIELNTENPPLNRDMHLLLDKVGAAKAAAEAARQSSGDDGAINRDLSLYSSLKH